MWSFVYSRDGLGAFLQSERQQRGITQQQMAKQLGVSPVTLSAIETGKNSSTQTVERYLQLLGFRAAIVPKCSEVKVTE